MRNISASVLLSFLFFAAGCSSSTDSVPPDDGGDDNGEITEGSVVKAFPRLSFLRPLDIQNAGDGSGRLFVAEQRGVITVFSNEKETDEAGVFLDIQNRVNDSFNEQGLLGLAFHPDYEENGTFYVNYTAAAPDRTVISRFRVSEEDHNRADLTSEEELLSYTQPYNNHNGGHLAFGPDGYLYIASGDGGGAGDPENNAQNRSNLLGAILRIDVDNPGDGENYRIPAGNPYAGNEEGYREEIFAHGLRNPWRFSFDADTGTLWAGDVGQSEREEINIIEGGLNYGWNITEGSACFPPGTECSKEGLELPVFEYDHSNGNRSVTGGFVYRGSDLPRLQGLYIYADFISGRIWALDPSDLSNPENTELYQADFNIASFGVDEQGEIYIAGFDGNIYRFGEDIIDAL